MDEFPNGTNAIVAVLAYTGGHGRRRVLPPANRVFPLTLFCSLAFGRLAQLSTPPSWHRILLAVCLLLDHTSCGTQLRFTCPLGIGPTPPCPALPLPAGYDMEDAMILNRASVERGFAHAYLYKTEQIDLREERGK